MAEFVVSTSMEAMNHLLAKLTTLMGDEYKKLKGVQKEVLFLKDELGTMNALLEKMDDADDNLDPLAKNWRKHVIEMAYDVEDCIDDFMQREGEADGKVGMLQKASLYLRSYKNRYDIANQIKEIKTRVIQISERRMRYKLDECLSNSPTLVPIDPRLSALYKESTNLVGIDKQKEDLVRWVMDEEQQLKVVSIVGFGGLGKTTLANEVYREVRGQFNCNTFVSISQKPEMTKILNMVLLQFQLQPSSYASEVQDLINILVGYLQDKRYLVVVDDLWDVRAWNIISCAFPRNNKKSRVIVTTRIRDVAMACCSGHGCIHIMKPLSETDSRKLFFNRIFSSEDTCPSQLVNVSSEILKKCGGLPLAIITVAGILACQPTRIKDHWEYIKNYLAPQSATHPTLQDMMRILDLSYKNLPRHLRACFMYLGLYPEDREIGKNELVRRWVAEGFVTNSHGQDAWEVAKSHFNELVNRSVIQPVYDKHNLEVISCRVHDMMLDMIVRRCREDNFIIVVRHPNALPEAESEQVRRLSVDLSGTEDDTMVSAVTTAGRLSQIRSLAIYGASKWMPPLSDFKFLRMLYLEFFKCVARIDLTGIIHLTQLRYIKVVCNSWSEDEPLRIMLPSQIQRLRHLETLEMTDASVCTMPADMVDLPRLSHLFLPSGTRFPHGIGKLKSLRTLFIYSLPKNSQENIRALGELTNMTILRLNCGKVYWETKLRRTDDDDDDDDTPEATWVAALSSSLQKLGNLKELYMTSMYESCNGDALNLLHPPFRNLEQLDLFGWTFSRVPRWMGELQNLRSLRLGLKLEATTSRSICWEEDIGIIGTLPSLVQLWLRMPIALTERIVIGGSSGFAVLEQLYISCDGISNVTFEAGAMLRLWKLSLGIDPDEWNKVPPDGLQHLSSLKEISIWVLRYYNVPAECDKAKDTSARELIKGVFQEAAGVLVSRPAVTAREEFDICSKL